MSILNAFIIGGLICGIGQLIMDKTKLMPIYITCLFVLLGALLDIFGLYDKLIDIGYRGALIPISSFGHAVTHGIAEEVANNGFIGIFTGVFNEVNVGISSAILFALIIALLVKPKG